ncbi:MAG: SDR family oxidoreductase [Betaproteobacteria bacterium]|jgi:NAD(P)-dependent dehydrogenase (short-subunit alcohol dehydrogenase family)
MKPDLGIPGKRVLVTAGANGIGRAIATTFADAGARVHICDVDTAAIAALAAERPDITASVADVSDIGQVTRLFEDVRTRLQGLDVLVNNAGIAGPTGRIEDIPVEDWERCIAIDLNGLFYCTRLAMPMIRAAGGGSIISLSSAAGRLGFPLRSPYAAAKWGVVGFTASLAIEAGQDGVRVNCIQPGVVEGDRIDRVAEAKARSFGVTTDEMKRRMVDKVSMRTMVTGQDIANMALFLASDAGRHISGQALSVCGNLESLA